jgi:peptidoglycan/xylan/chitin deacetylase (PgdA/CDA1 family)
VLRLGLTFHDVTCVGAVDSSGFPGPTAAHYKLSPEAFSAHLDEIEAVGLVPSLVREPGPDGLQLLLTFDDGGYSALDHVAPELAARRWPAHFFVTTGELDRPAFLARSALAELAGQGHLVGSHAHSHQPLTRMSIQELREELRRSKAILEDQLAAPVIALAAPGGFCSRRVAELAAEEGYRHLFTSEPWLRPREHGPLTLYGRFAIVAGQSPAQTAALLRLQAPVIWRRRAGWIARRSARRAFGPLYSQARQVLLARRARTA